MGGLEGQSADPAKRTDALRRVQTPVLAVVADNDPNLSEAQLLIGTVSSANSSCSQGKITFIQLSVG
jgi:hypothetical protein